MNSLSRNATPGSGELKGPLPGMAIIALWMVALCFLGLYGVVTHRLPMIATVFSALFAAAARGLLQQRRWGWALALGAAFLSMSYGTYLVLHLHQLPAIVMAGVNLVFFLYLIRPEVIERLR